MSGKTKVITFLNNKGGSAKTTTCTNVGYFLSEIGKKVLLLDGDAQLNLSLSLFPQDEVIKNSNSKHNLYHAIINENDLSDYIADTSYPNLDFIHSSISMSSIEYDLFPKWQRETVLKRCLEKIISSNEYDYILIDSPPTLGGWVMNILVASDYFIIPVEPSPWGLIGLGNLLEFLENMNKFLPHLSMLGIVLTKVDMRKNYTKQMQDLVSELDDIYIFENYIKVDSSIEWSQENSIPVSEYKKNTRSASEYKKLAKEIDAIVNK